MTMSRWTWTALAFLAFVPSARGQDPSPAAPEAPARSQSSPDVRDSSRAPAPTSLRVQVVFSKYQGETKVASLPYTLTCNTGERQAAVLRMGIEVPVPVEQLKDGTPTTSFQYKNVGTNIDCRAGMASPDGRFRLDLNVEQSSIYSVPDDKARRAPSVGGEGKPGGVTDLGIGGVPMFRTFRSTFNPILRDGQTVQYTSATDPVSGEVVKIDVTVNVVK
jgi:hypothetical protein